MIISWARDRRRGLGGRRSDGGDIITPLQTHSSTLIFRREAIAVAMTAAVVKAPALALHRLKVPDGPVVSARARVLRQLAHHAVCSTHRNPTQVSGGGVARESGPPQLTP